MTAVPHIDSQIKNLLDSWHKADDRKRQAIWQEIQRIVIGEFTDPPYVEMPPIESCRIRGKIVEP